MPAKNILDALGIVTVTWYRTEIFFETDYETAEGLVEDVSHLLKELRSDPDDVDFIFTPGSPASSPYFTIDGKSRKLVIEASSRIARFLHDRGVSVSPQWKS